MSEDQEKLSVLFADISGSSDIYEALGEEQASRSIAACIDFLNRLVESCQGTLVKVIGDEFMCTFPDAEQAFHAACAMQSAVEGYKFPDEMPVHIRIGFHFGEVSRESDDVFGDTVTIAAQVAAITRARQILVTHAVIESLPATLQANTRKLERVLPQTDEVALPVYLVSWCNDEEIDGRVGTAAQRKA
jgi:class 3 adenylate cyclase